MKLELTQIAKHSNNNIQGPQYCLPHSHLSEQQHELTNSVIRMKINMLFLSNITRLQRNNYPQVDAVQTSSDTI